MEKLKKYRDRRRSGFVFKMSQEEAGRVAGGRRSSYCAEEGRRI